MDFVLKMCLQYQFRPTMQETETIGTNHVKFYPDNE